MRGGLGAQQRPKRCARLGWWLCRTFGASGGAATTPQGGAQKVCGDGLTRCTPSARRPAGWLRPPPTRSKRPAKPPPQARATFGAFQRARAPRCVVVWGPTTPQTLRAPGVVALPDVWSEWGGRNHPAGRRAEGVRRCNAASRVTARAVGNTTASHAAHLLRAALRGGCGPPTRSKRPAKPPPQARATFGAFQRARAPRCVVVWGPTTPQTLRAPGVVALPDVWSEWGGRNHPAGRRAEGVRRCNAASRVTARAVGNTCEAVVFPTARAVTLEAALQRRTPSARRPAGWLRPPHSLQTSGKATTPGARNVWGVVGPQTTTHRGARARWNAPNVARAWGGGFAGRLERVGGPQPPRRAARRRCAALQRGLKSDCARRWEHV